MTLKTRITPLGAENKPYKKGFIVFESGIPDTYTCYIKKAYLDIWISGGGGGSSNGAGGTGATLHLRALFEKGLYTITVGTRGQGASAYVRNNNGYPGGLSSIKGEKLEIITNGGLGRNGRRNGGGGGGGSSGSHAWFGGVGGSAATFKGLIKLQKGTLTVTIGNGGAGGIGSGRNASPGSNGTPTIISFNGKILLTLGAGNGGSGTGDFTGWNNGAGGSLSIGELDIVSSTIQTNGVNSSSVSILGNGFGAGGAIRGGNSGLPGTSGYVKLVFYK